MTLALAIFRSAAMDKLANLDPETAWRRVRETLYDQTEIYLMECGKEGDEGDDLLSALLDVAYQLDTATKQMTERPGD